MTGYQLARSVANYAEDVVVVTHHFFQEAIENAGGLGMRAKAAAPDVEDKVQQELEDRREIQVVRAGLTSLSFPTAIAFEREVWRRFQPELTGGQF